MKKILGLVLVITLLLQGCNKEGYTVVEDNIIKLIQHDSFKHERDYDAYIKNLDDWAAGEAYDKLIVLPDNLKEILDDSEVVYGKYDVKPEVINIYASFKEVDLDEFSNFYLFESDEFIINSEGGEGDSVSYVWDDKLSEWFNPDKKHDVREAVCFVGYGYYNIIVGNVNFRYYIAVKCNKDGKVENFINNYLSSY